MIMDMKYTRKNMNKKANPQRRRRRVMTRKKKKRATKGGSQRVVKKVRMRSHPRMRARLAAIRLKITSLEVTNLVIQRNKQKKWKNRRVGKISGNVRLVIDMLKFFDRSMPTNIS